MSRLLGVTCFEQLDPSYLHKCTPVNAPYFASEFPLLEEGY